MNLSKDSDILQLMGSCSFVHAHWVCWLAGLAQRILVMERAKREQQKRSALFEFVNFDALGLRLFCKKDPADSSGGIGMVRKSETSPVLVLTSSSRLSFPKGH